MSKTKLYKSEGYNNKSREFLEDYDLNTKKVINSSKRNIIINNFSQLHYFIDEALNTNNNYAIHLGIINEKIIEEIKNKIFNISSIYDYLKKDSYDLVINQSEIRHLLNNKNTLTKDDIHNYVEKLPVIITECDFAIFSKQIKNEGIRFKKKFDDGSYISFALISNKKRTLTIKSIYMIKKDFETKKRSISLPNDVKY